METWITSDVHLGARQSRAVWFRSFLEKIPPHVRLVLNGDVVTRLRGESRLPPEHGAVLDVLRALSLRQEVIWVTGNHDRRFALSGMHAIRFEKEYTVDHQLFVTHGDCYDHLSQIFRFVLLPIRVVYEFCTRVIGSRTHVADFAKYFPLVYEVLNGHVVRHATADAKMHGFVAVICGHTHHPGVRVENEVTYYNTGCWTEDSAHVLVIKDNAVLRLMRVAPDGSVC